MQQFHRAFFGVADFGPGLDRRAVLPLLDAADDLERIILVAEHRRPDRGAVGQGFGFLGNLGEAQRHRAVGVDDLETGYLEYVLLCVLGALAERARRPVREVVGRDCASPARDSGGGGEKCDFPRHCLSPVFIEYGFSVSISLAVPHAAGTSG